MTLEYLQKRLSNVHFYIDMDGVLAKWKRVPVEETYKEGYYASLEPDDNVVALAMKLADINPSNVTVLSAVYSEGTARAEKDWWLCATGLFPKVDYLFVPYGENKHDYIKTSGVNILLDDYTKNLKEWESAGYVGVKYRNDFNGTNGTWNSYSIDCNQSYDDMFYQMLAIVDIEAAKQQQAVA